MLIKVKVFPSSKKEEIVKKSEDEFLVKVREEAKENKANNAVLNAVSLYLGLPRSKLIIIKGHRKRNKMIKIYGL